MNKALSRFVRPLVLLGASVAVNLHTQPIPPDVVLQFEPPRVAGDGQVITFWTEQGFNVSAPTNRMVHQDSGPVQYPHNGGAYLTTFPIQNTLNNIIISNAAGALFDVKTVDLAEWSPDPGTNLTVTFRGLSANGLVVAGRVFTLDRVYDGAGPTTDFQTFTFPSTFVQLRELWVSTETRFALDNLRLAAATFTNALPTVTVLTPTNGQTFVEGEDVVVDVAAEDTDGTIARVNLFVDGRTYVLTNPPYSIVLSNVLRGTHGARATAVDDLGGQGTSGIAVFFNVVPSDAPPLVLFSSPPHGSSLAPSEPVLLQVEASQPSGSIVNVAFYAGPFLVGIDDEAPYSLLWSNATPGSYFITAVATGNRGATANASILILVAQESLVLTFDPPTVPGGSQAISNWTEQGYSVRAPITRMSHVDSGTVTNVPLPSNGSAYLRFIGGGGGIPIVSNIAGATFSALSIDLAETGTTNLTFRGLTVSSNIVSQQFLLDGIGDGTGPSPDFQTFRFNPSFSHLVRLEVFAGTLAMDNLRLFTEPSNAAPVVTLTSPTNSARFNDLADISITGIATDPDGQVMRVQIFADEIPLGESRVSIDGEFAVIWSNAWAGSHILMAKAYDFSGAVTVSPPVSIVVSTNPFAPITIRFEPATLPGGSAGIRSWSEHGFLFEAPVPMSHTDSGESEASPANAGAYLRFSAGAQPLTITYPSGQAFRLHSVDLAEYSTIFTRLQIRFLGTRLDDSTVLQAFLLDGSIDGTGPLADFQTFFFSAGFANLKKVEVLTDGYSLDNLRVEVSLPNQPPTITLLAPSGSVTNVQGDVVEVRAEASDPDGEVVRVDYFFGTNFAASASSPPYAASFIIDQPGIYGIYAVAIDNDGASASSESATLRVQPKPEVRIIAPPDGATYLAGRPILIEAQASSIGANIMLLELLAGNTTIAEIPGPSLIFPWADVAPGDYFLSARATDQRNVTGVSAPVLVKVRANSPPSFVVPPSVQVPEDSGSQTLANWASAIAAGPAYEAEQTVFFEVSNNNPGLFAVQPAITPAGELSFTPAADANGSAIVSVLLHDDGGTQFQGQDVSALQTFVLTVTPVNDPPIAQATLRSSAIMGTNDGVLLILAADGTAAEVILDGSSSTDPENDLLGYDWLEEANLIAEGQVATNAFAPGFHEVTLAVSDGVASSMSAVRFEVVAPETAVEFVTAVVEEADLSSRNKRPLVSTLKAASASFAQGKVSAAIGQIAAFQNKLRAQIALAHPELAAILDAEAQKLLDLIAAAAPPAR